MSIYSKTATPASIRRKANGLKFKKERARIAAIKDIKPVRDPARREWIRQQPCCVPNCICRVPGALSPLLRVVQCAHTGPHALSQKASDLKCVALCFYMHQEAPDAQGKTRTFFEDHRMDLGEILADYDRRYAAYLEGLK